MAVYTERKCANVFVCVCVCQLRRKKRSREKKSVSPHCREEARRGNEDDDAPGFLSTAGSMYSDDVSPS